MQRIDNRGELIALTTDGDTRPIYTLMKNHPEWQSCYVFNVKDIVKGNSPTKWQLFLYDIEKAQRRHEAPLKWFFICRKISELPEEVAKILYTAIVEGIASVYLRSPEYFCEQTLNREAVQKLSQEQLCQVFIG